ncbi:MAG TPA: shikimate dehydrogenase [Pseudogracilibacillus sp.]|nr:shikimate dehydrogenase [Pseudogracilibacillus sp.]
MTYLFGLIGYPIKHSLSPWIHTQFMEKTNITGSYEIFEIDLNTDFKQAIAELRERNINGFNITVPYKEKIISELDSLDDQAKRIGAVNTVLNYKGQLIGYNTDGLGYVKSLEMAYPKIKTTDIKILLLGAGGAARGIYNGLKGSGYLNIDIANRTIEKAEEIKKTFTKGETKVMSLQAAEQVLDQYDLIVQTTSVGMKPNVAEEIVNLNKLKPNVIVSDIVYQPIMTQFLKSAQEKGAQIHTGHTMLLYQAQLAFNIWTETQVDVGNMDKKLEKILEG